MIVIQLGYHLRKQEAQGSKPLCLNKLQQRIPPSSKLRWRTLLAIHVAGVCVLSPLPQLSPSQVLLSERLEARKILTVQAEYLLPNSSVPVQRVGLPRIATEFTTGTKTARGTTFPSDVV
jgi:hypothetical protein